MAEKTIAKATKIDPDAQQFQEVPDRLQALEAAVAELQRGGIGLSVEVLERLLTHHHQIRSGMLNYVDKPVLIKDGSFVPIHDGPNKKV